VLIGCRSQGPPAGVADDAGLAALPATPAASAATPSVPAPFVLPDRPYDLAADLRTRTDDVHRRFGKRAGVRTESDVFLFAGTDPGARLDDAVALAHRALPRYFAGRFSKHPDRAVTVLLFGSHERFRVECAKLVDERRCKKPLGFYWPMTREILADVSQGVETVTHELVHPIVQTDWPTAPAWLDEGIGSLFERPVFDGDDGIHGATNWRLDVLQASLGNDAGKSAAQVGALFGMSDDAFRGENEDRSYAVSRFLCQWLDEKGELWRFYRAWRDGRKQEGAGVAAFTEVVGEKPEQAQLEWWTWAKGLRLVRQ
jgi:hypothetical protein